MADRLVQRLKAEVEVSQAEVQALCEAMGILGVDKGVAARSVVSWPWSDVI